MKIEFKSIMFLIAVGALILCSSIAISPIIKAIIYLSCLIYIVKYCWDAYIIYQVENPDLINEGVNKMRKDKRKV